MTLSVSRGACCCAVLGLLAASLAASAAQASEGGVSFYLLGSGGPGAAILPPLRGVFLDNTAFYYHGSAKAYRQFVIGGNVVAGVDATLFGALAGIMTPFFSSKLRNEVREFGNLTAYVDRMMQRYYPEFSWAPLRAREAS